MVERTEKSAEPKSVLSTLKAGFDVTTRHWSILTVPLLLDCLLWLGPRFRFHNIVRAELDGFVLQAPADFSGFQPDTIEQFYQLIERSNLLTALSVPLFGVPALFGGITPEKIPLAAGSVEIGSMAQVGGMLVALTLIGLLLSGIFYVQVARAVTLEQGDDFGRNPISKIFQLFGLGIALFFVLVLLTFPIIFIATIAGLFSIGLAYAVLIGGSVVIMWGIILTSFSAHALMLDRKSPFRAISHSVRFVRKNLSVALPLLLIVVVTNSLVENMMLSADSGSWLTAISIAGHAFIATSLLVATFIFYKDTASTQNSVLNT